MRSPTLGFAAMLCIPLLLGACAQPVEMTAETAEDVCRSELARNSTVRPNIGIGIGRGGPRVRTGVTVPVGALDARPYDQRLADCVSRRMMGQGPGPNVGVSVGTTL
jgi:hypothetical protein